MSASRLPARFHGCSSRGQANRNVHGETRDDRSFSRMLDPARARCVRTDARAGRRGRRRGGKADDHRRARAACGEGGRAGAGPAAHGSRRSACTCAPRRTCRRTRERDLLHELRPPAPRRAAPAAEEARPPPTAVLVRHGEKAAAPPQDPPLTEAGAARARALLDALADARVNAIYSTNYARTRDTAQPLSDAAGVPVTVISD